MEDWYIKWRFKINHIKSVHTTFTLKRAQCPDVILYGTRIPQSQIVICIGLTLGRRLTWDPNIKTKTLALNTRHRMLNTLISNHQTKINTILQTYKSLIKPL